MSKNKTPTTVEELTKEQKRFLWYAQHMGQPFYASLDSLGGAALRSQYPQWLHEYFYTQERPAWMEIHLRDDPER